MLVWAFAVGAGFEVVWRYQSTPGVVAQAPRVWPGSTLVTPETGRSTLVMFVHPRCTCTRASLAELARIMERAGGSVSASVLFFRPSGVDDRWEETPTWGAAHEIAGVHVLIDREGAEAARFGAHTSGHLLLYAPDGRLEFAGGITGSRAHVGDNDGESSVLALLKGTGAALHEHAVYGCSFADLKGGRT
ncbi:MAG: RedB protein [Steroidobacteraceae bacterium]